MTPSLSHEVLERIREQLRKNNKIMAVRLYREATSLGLAESLQAVEAIAAGVRSVATAAPQVLQSTVAKVKDVSEHEQWPQIRDEILRGNVIEAIKLFRQAMDVPLLEAKRGVEALAEKMQASGETPTPSPMATPPPLPSQEVPSPTDALNSAWARIRSEVLRGNKLEAIRIYRESHRVGLAEAKKIVESYHTSLTGRPRTELRTPASSKLMGCGFLLLAVGAVLVGLTGMHEASQNEAVPSFKRWIPWIGAVCFIAAAISALRARRKDGEN
jgi:ribosomal protein L7/L12